MARRSVDPSMRMGLLEAGARLLSSEGPAALSTRRVAAEAGTSTMSVYTHFGSMPDLVAAIVEEGFTRLGTALALVPQTDDAILDLAEAARAYRTNALDNPELYSVMFGSASLGGYRPESADIAAAGLHTFEMLVSLADRAIEAGRLDPADPHLVASQLWSALHGFLLLEIAGHFGTNGNAEELILTPLLLNLIVGLGADRDATIASAMDKTPTERVESNGG
ncbi:TetR/AcrR family transcriptional regulator [Rhodococcus sp. ABRD24]|uniref:TetR/AcrR family transcriptional regulator n=1 Tax=Rhodococcus sp. ABRD24 TaxID=2507582 RepID=UPI00103FB56D|nr:TetR/AcrR family transcriptional regulator [Rhodococcus sp. ABRD24]QBJ95840.1 TetR/AcrR family transcriptional regulator [Rhodococcus sp. ABRD24]